MPPRIPGASMPGSKGSFVTQNDLSKLKSVFLAEYKERYPTNDNNTPIDMKPGSELHDLVRDEIIQRAHEGRIAIEPRFASWRELDQSMTAYIPTDEAEKALKSVDSRKPTSIVIPQGFADRETFLTYFSASLLEDPIFKYSGVAPEDVVGALLMEHVISWQSRRFKHALALAVGLSDAVTYGFCAWWLSWDVMMGSRTRSQETPNFNEDGTKAAPTINRIKEATVLAEGNTITAIDPYKILRDPSMSVQDFQKGEYFGCLDSSTYVGMLEQEVSNKQLFNVRYLDAGNINGRSFLNTELRTGREDKKGTVVRGKQQMQKIRPIDIIRMQITLIPSEWRTTDGKVLGKSDSPEKWEFGLAGDAVIVMARKMTQDHNMFTAAMAAPIDVGHTSTPTSLLEIGYAMNHGINYLWNTHIANVRKTVNNVFVLNPRMVNEFDLDNAAKAGGKIRMRQAAWQAGKWQDHIGQLPVGDVTANNVRDMGLLIDLDNNTLGVADQAKGVIRPRGERVSATEVTGARQSGLSRLERMARTMGMQAFFDMAYIFASHTREFMKEEMYVRVTGDLEEQLREEHQIVKNSRVRIKPKDIDVDFDIIGHDGSISSLQGDPQTMVQALQVAASNPEAFAQLDMTKVFFQIARAMGIKNAHDWKKRQPPVSVQPDELVQNELGRGNLVALEDATNGQ